MSSHLERLLVSACKPERLVVGLMSGTSMDAIDVAVCRIGPRGVPITLVHYGERAFEPDLKTRLTRFEEMNVRAVAEANVLVGEAFAAAALAVLDEARIDVAEVDLVGSHGQTVYHHSTVPGSSRATLQLGDGDVIAERMRLPVISDFRARDVATGGEGAPLSPRADLVLYGHALGTARLAVLNLGGIANVTVLDADSQRIRGFDIGPANALIDRAVSRFSEGVLCYDRDGLIAGSGHINEILLKHLINIDSFLFRSPPKSTGFEMYGDAFLDRAATLHGGIDANLIATLTEFTARGVAIAFDRFIPEITIGDEVIVAGGGGANQFLMARLNSLLAPRTVRRSEELGVPSSAREAMAFAIFADLTLRGECSSLPDVTGALRPAVLGKLSFGP